MFGTDHYKAEYYNELCYRTEYFIQNTEFGALISIFCCVSVTIICCNSKRFYTTFTWPLFYRRCASWMVISFEKSCLLFSYSFHSGRWRSKHHLFYGHYGNVNKPHLIKLIDYNHEFVLLTSDYCSLVMILSSDVFISSILLLWFFCIIPPDPNCRVNNLRPLPL
jgi:hypothetical protein